MRWAVGPNTLEVLSLKHLGSWPHLHPRKLTAGTPTLEVWSQEIFRFQPFVFGFRGSYLEAWLFRPYQIGQPIMIMMMTMPIMQVFVVVVFLCRPEPSLIEYLPSPIRNSAWDTCKSTSRRFWTKPHMDGARFHGPWSITPCLKYRSQM